MAGISPILKAIYVGNFCNTTFLALFDYTILFNPFFGLSILKYSPLNIIKTKS